MAKDKPSPHSVFVRLVLPPYTIHFKSPTYMKESTLELLDKRICKETLKSTAQRADVREAIGTDPKFWTDLTLLLRAAIPSLERRSFAVWDPSAVDYESTSGALIAAHYPALWKDLERLNDLVSISRNVLTVGGRAQDLASDCNVDAQIFRLVNCCVRVTARGFDGDAGPGEEEKWQWIVNAYKKLLITNVQFLNNLVAQNERRKLMLWVSLFDGESVLGEEALELPIDRALNPLVKPERPWDNLALLVAYGRNDIKNDALVLTAPRTWHDRLEPIPQPPAEYYKYRATLAPSGWLLFCQRSLSGSVAADGRPHSASALHLELCSQWDAQSKQSKERFHAQALEAAEMWRNEMAVYNAKKLALEQKEPQEQNDGTDATITSGAGRLHTKQIAARIAQLEEQLAERYRLEATKVAPLELPVCGQEGLVMFPNSSESSGGPRTVQTDDYKMLFTAEAGSKILESGKAELMKRLEGYPPAPGSRQDVGQGAQQARRAQQGEIQTPVSPVQSPASPTNEDNRTEENGDEVVDEESEEEEEEEESDEDEEEYPGSTEDGRGLLTDVPLILGPSEIEVLPMIVMSGIVPPPNQLALCQTLEEKNALINMHTVRCHLLLAQDNGRNLLRELLIFVAAWDLREEELYFKFMVKIMEAILNNGLMPYAYHAFRDKSRSKDIISPAQAVIMKLLTNIFRARAETAKAANIAQKAAATISTTAEAPPTPSYPLRVDVHIVNFIFTEFRQHIIPQTCALIFLQGKIHQNLASPEDFPLNLWDMERMYEGVYQYLEFFAVLTEEGVWKEVIANWEVASELVTLLRELEGGIPKLGIGGGTGLGRKGGLQQQPPAATAVQRSASADAKIGGGAPAQAPASASVAPVAVERPFDVELPAPPDPALPPLPIPVPASTPNQIFEAETPLAYPEDAQDEPSDFEWRNLKKLTVLVLSSLIWKNRKVQDQVRDYDGLEALVGCCRHDDHNPYIREHAIMCLRFAVEGNEENAKVIKRMAGVGQGHSQQQQQQQQQHVQGGTVTMGAVENVPREVLDTNGYETFMDNKGQVGLRRKNTNDMHGAASGVIVGGHASTGGVAASAGAGPSAAALSKPPRSTTKMTAEKAAELMQNALRDLPPGEKSMSDSQKREALAKLDKAFGETEKALGGEGGRK